MHFSSVPTKRELMYIAQLLSPTLMQQASAMKQFVTIQESHCCTSHITLTFRWVGIGSQKEATWTIARDVATSSDTYSGITHQWIGRATVNYISWKTNSVILCNLNK